MFKLRILVNNTKMDVLISRISDLNNQINNGKIAASFDHLNEASELLAKEKGYEYFFRESIETERRRGVSKRRRTNYYSFI